MGYIGGFLAGFLGAGMPLFPSYVLIPMMATQPFVVGVVSGVGAGVGQYLHYYVGLGGRCFFSAESRTRFEKWRMRFDKYGAWLIAFMAATPLTPDDDVWVPWVDGLPKVKALLAGIAGKIVLGLVYGYAGYYECPLIDQLLKVQGLG
jgi:uncharacterized membrane protein YdjX (TVP38/TMEM64 family)